MTTHKDHMRQTYRADLEAQAERHIRRALQNVRRAMAQRHYPNVDPEKIEAELQQLETRLRRTTILSGG